MWYVTSILKPVYFTDFIDIYTHYPTMWHNKIRHYFNCKRVASTSVLPFYVIAVLPHDGCNYWSEHFVVNTVNNEHTIMYDVLFRGSINQH